MPNPAQLYGIEIDFYAHEIASVVVWIGFLQWKHDHGIKDDHSPLLQKLTNIEHADAIMRLDPGGKPYEPTWHETDYIIGNPPFLGGKFLRRELGDEYVDDIFELYKSRVPAEADIVVYWFEKARSALEAGAAKRVGLLATQSIRAGANLRVLQRIKESGDIFMSWSDRPWILAGASVRVSMIAFDEGTEETKSLDGNPVAKINANLTSEANIADAATLSENTGLSFMGTTQVGPFDLSAGVARKFLDAPKNPNGRPNSDVVRPWVNAIDITRLNRGMYVIDFGTSMSEAEAALYELPFQYLQIHVLPGRQTNNRETYRKRWWLHGEPRSQMRRALGSLERYIATPGVAKHRMFVWLDKKYLPDHRLFVIARQDDYFFGVLSSRLHEVWSLAACSWHGVGNDPTYNSTKCFETFAFPYPPGTEPSESDSPIIKSIADAARELVSLRDAWLNPEPVDGRPIPEAELKKRTLTNLYNERPTWLGNAHRTLDEAVFAAYGWPLEMNGKALSDQDILSRLLALNHERAAAQLHKA